MKTTLSIQIREQTEDLRIWLETGKLPCLPLEDYAEKAYTHQILEVSTTPGEKEKRPGENILQIAAKSGKLKQIPAKFLKKRNILPSYLPKRNGERYQGKSPFTLACIHEHTDQIPESLLTVGNALKESDEGKNTIHHACIEGTLCSLPKKFLIRETLLCSDSKGYCCLNYTSFVEIIHKEYLRKKSSQHPVSPVVTCLQPKDILRQTRPGNSLFEQAKILNKLRAIPIRLLAKNYKLERVKKVLETIPELNKSVAKYARELRISKDYIQT